MQEAIIDIKLYYQVTKRLNPRPTGTQDFPPPTGGGGGGWGVWTPPPPPRLYRLLLVVDKKDKKPFESSSKSIRKLL